jgi:hypothetical protein
VLESREDATRELTIISVLAFAGVAAIQLSLYVAAGVLVVVVVVEVGK